MKYSGVEWIGEIPENWKLNKIGQLFNLRNEKVSDKDYSPLSVSKGGIVPQMENVAKSDASDDRKLVLKGDFAINSRSDRKMSCGVSPLDGSVSLINTILYPKNDDVIYNNYMNYLLKNYGFAEEFYRWGHGIVADLWTTKWQEMKSIMLPLPSVQKQKATYDFLNQKTAEIDSLIDIENQQIEKLKEYKQAVITEAVTKGLDKNVPLKDSGVEWIGKIPEGWNTIKIKFTSWLKGRIGWDGLKSGEFIEEGPYLITGTDFIDGGINWDTCVHISEERFMEDELLHIYENDLLITKDGTIGKLAIVKDCPKKVSLNSGVMIIRNTTKWKYLDKYLYYILSSEQFYLWYGLSQSGNSTIKHLYQGQFYNFEFTYPDLNEQKKISDYLDEKCADIDKLIEIKKQKIDQLDEYKKSLIYEYVTGKKEVC